MGYFLNTERRHELLEFLTDLSMPRVYAEAIVSVEFNSNDLEAIDAHLARRPEGITIWAAEMAKAAEEGDQEKISMFGMYIIADMKYLDVMTDECRDRNILNRDNMPKLIAALESGLVKSKEIKVSLEDKMAEMGVTPEGQPITRH